MSVRKVVAGFHAGRTAWIPRPRAVFAAVVLLLALVPLLAPSPATATLLEDLENELGRQVDRVSRSMVTVVAHANMGSAPRLPFVAGPFGLYPRDLERHAAGCGLVIDSLGYVLTTATVVRGASRVDLVCPDGRLVPAKVVGFDAMSDVALLRADRSPARGRWEPAPLGDSRRMSSGAWVTVLGNAYGVGPSVSTGVVSRRSVVSSRTGERLLQMNVRAGPGDMGGAVLDSRGNVVGMVCAILADPRDQGRSRKAAMARDASVAPGSGGGSGSSRPAVVTSETGISFALPVGTALEVARHLRTEGRLQRGFLGVEINDAPVDAGVTATTSSPGSGSMADGACVGRVLPGGPADRAGVAAGDVIVAADGTRLLSAAALRRKVMGSTPGTRLKLTVKRGEALVDLDVTVGTQPDVLPPTGGAGHDERMPDGAAMPSDDTADAAMSGGDAGDRDAHRAIEARIQDLEQELQRLRDDLESSRQPPSP